MPPCPLTNEEARCEKVMRTSSFAPRFAVAFACLCVSACAGETQARPPHAASSSDVDAHADRAPLPLPDTAFRGDGREEEAEPTATPISRFHTRRIGADDGTEGRRSRFRGAPVDLDLKGADLQDVFRLLADVGKVNLVVAGEVSGTITMKLRRVPWDQALDVVAKAKNLSLERDGNVILVRPHGAKD